MIFNFNELPPSQQIPTVLSLLWMKLSKNKTRLQFTKFYMKYIHSHLKVRAKHSQKSALTSTCYHSQPCFSQCFFYVSDKEI